MSPLTAVDVAERAMKEIDLQRFLVGKDGIAPLFGWEHVHFRPAMTAHGMRTPASGSMASGWPDLVLIRERDRRLIFAELKRQTGEPSPDQVRVLAVLAALDGQYISPSRSPFVQGDVVDLRIDVVVWRPSDFRDPFDESPGGRLLR